MSEIEVLHTIKHVLDSGVLKVIQCRDEVEARDLEKMFRDLLYGAPLYIRRKDDVLMIKKM